MILGDNSLVCFGGGSSEVVSTLSPTLSVIVGFGAHGQLGSGNNETYGDEVRRPILMCTVVGFVVYSRRSVDDRLNTAVPSAVRSKSSGV